MELARSRQAVREALEEEAGEAAKAYEVAIYNRVVREKAASSEKLARLYQDRAYELAGSLLAAEPKDRKRVLDRIRRDLDPAAPDPTDEAPKESAVQVPEGEYTCRNPKCRSKRCSFSADQTRSSDEGATITILCSVCASSYRLH